MRDENRIKPGDIVFGRRDMKRLHLHQGIDDLASTLDGVVLDRREVAIVVAAENDRQMNPSYAFLVTSSGRSGWAPAEWLHAAESLVAPAAREGSRA